MGEAAEKIEVLPARATEAKPNVKLVDGKGLVPQDFDGLWRMASVMAVSGFVPKDMAGKPESVFVACQFGYELGLTPMQSVQNISVINGRPAMWGDAVLALVRSSGKLTGFKEEVIGSGDKLKAVCIAMRGKEEIRREFSVEMAKKAGLWGKNTWAAYPERMLQMRARSWTLRDGFGDILKGIQSVEEIKDGADVIVVEASHAGPPDVESYEQPIDAEAVEKFEIMVDEQPEHMRKKVDDFLSATAEANGSTVEGVQVAAVDNFEAFWEAYEKWFYPKALTHASGQDAEAYKKACSVHGCEGAEINKMKPIQQKAVYETYRKMR